MLLFFGITLFLTNTFHPEEVGRYDFSRSLIMFLGGICVFGMHQSVLYFSGFLKANDSEHYLAVIYRKMILIALAIAVFILCVALILSAEQVESFFDKAVYSLFIKTIAALFFYALFMLNIDVLRAVNRIYWSEIYRNLIRYGGFGIGIGIIVFLEKDHWLVDVFLLNFLILALLTTAYLLFIFRKSSGDTSKVQVGFKDIIKRSGPMAVSAIAYILMQSVDVILLSKYTDFSQVAFYSVALKLTMLVSLVLASVNSVIAPKISEMFSANQKDQLSTMIKQSTRLTLALTLPAIIVLAVLSKFILNIFGTEYVVAKSALFVLLIGQTVNAFCGSVGVYMNMTGKQNIFQLILISALVLNVVLNVILIPKMGIEGAAIATSTSMILWNLITVAYIYRTDKVKTFAH